MKLMGEANTSGQYLTGLLAQETRPFIYRSNVYRLLGQSGVNDRTLRVSSQVFLAGFQYLHSRGYTQVSTQLDNPVRNERVRSQLQPSLVSEQSHDQGERVLDDIAEVDEIPKIVGHVNKRSIERAPMSKSTQHATTPIVHEGVAQQKQEVDAPSRVQQTKLALPGITNRKVLFKALSKSDASVDQAHPSAESVKMNDPEKRVMVAEVLADMSERVVVEKADRQGSTAFAKKHPVRGKSEQKLLTGDVDQRLQDGTIEKKGSPAEYVVNAVYQKQTIDAKEFKFNMKPAQQKDTSRLTQKRPVPAIPKAPEVENKNVSTHHHIDSHPPAPNHSVPQEVVVRKVFKNKSRVPRSFWTNSMVRCSHLRMLR